MIAAYLNAMRCYVRFDGRAPRSELWWFKLVTVFLCLAALMVDGLLFGGTDDEMAPLFCIVALGHFLPSVAVDVRRLHDVDRSGWFALVGLVPLIGPIVLLVWFCQAGTPGANRFGADPLADAATSAVRSPESGRLARGGHGNPIGSAVRDAVTEIERLATLRAGGTLSETEFETLKTQVLAGAVRT